MNNTNLNIPFYILLVAWLALACALFISHNKTQSLKKELTQEVALKNALVDTLHTSRNVFNEEVTTKLTLQASVKQLEDKNNKLSIDKKNLLDRIKTTDKNSSIISAALVRTTISLDSIINKKGIVDSIKHMITFNDSTAYIKYKLIINNIVPTSSQPSLLFDQLSFTNKQYVSFYWGDKRDGYPVSFSISNSNKYIKVSSVESYIIPSIDKKVLVPTTWDKIKAFNNKSTGKITLIGIGISIGYIFFHML